MNKGWVWMAMAVLAGATAGAAEPGASYATALQREGAALSAGLSDLNRRYVAALENLQVDARSRGELDETLAAQRLVELVKPLATGRLFAGGAPLPALTVLALPAAPAGFGRVQQAHTNYLAKAAALVTQFNAAASNRLARHLSELDGVIRDRTKAGELDAAVKLREQRTAVAAAGPPRLVIAGSAAGEPPRVAAAPAAVSNPFLGRWQVPGNPVPIREFKADGTAAYYWADGKPRKVITYSIKDSNTLITARDSEGWVDTYRLLSAAEGVVEARKVEGGQTLTHRILREGVVAGGHPILGIWCDTWDAAYPGQTRVFDPQGVFRAVKSNGVEYARGPYKLTGPDTAEFVWPDKTITRYRVLSDGRLQLTRLQANGTEQITYCTRPGIVRAMTVWAPGEEAKGTWAKDWTFEGKGVQTGIAKIYSAGGRPDLADAPGQCHHSVQVDTNRATRPRSPPRAPPRRAITRPSGLATDDPCERRRGAEAGDRPARLAYHRGEPEPLRRADGEGGDAQWRRWGRSLGWRVRLLGQSGAGVVPSPIKSDG